MSAHPDPRFAAGSRLAAPLLRPMREFDIPSVVVNEQAAYPHPWNERIFMDCLRVGYACRVAEGADGVIGHSVLSIAAGDGHLLNVCVNPAYQRRGVGRRLLEQAIRNAREHGAKVLYLEVRPSNVPAIELYRTSGFTRIGSRKGYYPLHGGMREDAFVFSLDL